VRQLVATVFNYSLDGFLADEGTEFWKFCFEVNGDLPEDPARLEFLRTAYAHIMGRGAYESMSANSLANSGHPLFDLMNAGRKIVFSRTLRTAEWANTTIAAGDTEEEIGELRRGDGHIVVWGGVTLWRSLLRVDLIDELRVDLYPYVCRRGHPAVRGCPHVLPIRPGLQQRHAQRDRRASVPPAPLSSLRAAC
jgi:dihydrofolate reductase